MRQGPSVWLTAACFNDIIACFSFSRQIDKRRFCCWRHIPTPSEAKLMLTEDLELADQCQAPCLRYTLPDSESEADGVST